MLHYLLALSKQWKWRPKQMNNLEVKMGTLSGVSLSMFLQMPWRSVQETIALAIIGAAVSFFISRYLQWLFNKK